MFDFRFNMIKEMKYVTLKPGKMFLLILSSFITTFQVLNKFIKEKGPNKNNLKYNFKLFTKGGGLTQKEKKYKKYLAYRRH